MEEKARKKKRRKKIEFENFVNCFKTFFLPPKQTKVFNKIFAELFFSFSFL